MAFFAPAFTTSESLSPFFRLFNDFDGPAFDTSSSSPLAAYVAPLPCRRNQTRRSVTSFQPKFDVRETADAYELHGELAGLSKKDVHIEFTDPQTLVVRGRIERCYTSKPHEQQVETTTATPETVEAPADDVHKAESKPTDNSGHEETQTAATTEAPASPKFHKATVEDSPDQDDSFSVTSMSTTHTGAAQATEQTTQEQPAAHVAPAAPAASTAVQTKAKTEADATKYWVQERSVGEFSRTFSFPRLVRQDEVHAALENGILTVVVPKARMETRRVVVF